MLKKEFGEKTTAYLTLILLGILSVLFIIWVIFSIIKFIITNYIGFLVFILLMLITYFVLKKYNFISQHKFTYFREILKKTKYFIAKLIMWIKEIILFLFNEIRKDNNEKIGHKIEPDEEEIEKIRKRKLDPRFRELF